MTNIPLIIWIIGIIFSAGAVYSSVRVSVNEVKHIKRKLEKLNDNDNKQNERLMVIERRLNTIDEEINRLRDKSNGIK